MIKPSLLRFLNSCLTPLCLQPSLANSDPPKAPSDTHEPESKRQEDPKSGAKGGEGKTHAWVTSLNASGSPPLSGWSRRALANRKKGKNSANGQVSVRGREGGPEGECGTHFFR